MNNSEKIKNRFLHFEPDVDETSIDNNWIKMKYFLPRKKKRRFALLLIFTNGWLIAFIFCAIFAGNYFNTQFHLKKTLSREKVAGEIEGQKKYSSQKPDPYTLKSLNRMRTSKKIHLKSSAQAPASVQIENSIESVSFPSGSDGNGSGLDTVHPVNLSPDSGVNYIKAFELFADTLTTATTFSVSEILLSLKEVPACLSEVKNVSVDLVTGFQQAFSTVKSTKGTKENHFSNLIIGAAIKYQVQKVLAIEGRATFGQNHLDYNEGSISNKILLPFVFTTGGVYDTTRYIQAESKLKISSKAFWQAAIGLSCETFTKRRYFLDAALFFSTRRIKYNYTVENHFSQDTLKYAYGQSSSPFLNVVEPSFTEGKIVSSSSILSYGIIPSLTSGLRVNSKLSVIIKVEWFWEFSKNNLNFKDYSFVLHQNALLSKFGIRYKL